MSHTPRCLYGNVDFDVRCGHYSQSGKQRRIDELSQLFAVLGNSEDRILLSSRPEPDWYQYLEHYGISPALPLREDERCPDYHPFPWAWDENAVNRFVRAGIPVHHPPLHGVRMVNARSFSFRLGLSTATGVPGARLFSRAVDVQTFITHEAAIPAVIKPMHGNSATGFILKESRAWQEAEVKKLNRLFSPGTPAAVVEPWLDRLVDMSTSITVESGGPVQVVRQQRCFNSVSGVFTGMILDPHDAHLSPYRTALTRNALLVGEALRRAGYFGPAGIDSFVYRDTAGDSHLVPLVEINARRTMSCICGSLQQKLNPGKPCLFRLVPSQHLHLPQSYEHLKFMLDASGFSPSRSGIIMVSPLAYTVKGQRKRPRRLGFFITGNTADDVAALEQELMRRLGRQRPTE